MVTVHRGARPSAVVRLAAGAALALVLVGSAACGGSGGRAENKAAVAATDAPASEAPAADPSTTPPGPDPSVETATSPPGAPPATTPPTASAKPTRTRTTTRPAVPPAPAGPVGQVLALVNVERARAKCPAVTADSRLAAAAQAHSADMAAKQYFSHTS